MNNTTTTIKWKAVKSDTSKRHQVWFLFSVWNTNRFCLKERQTAARQGKAYSFRSSSERTEKEERLKENVTNRTEIINSSAATHARSYVRGLWPVSHIIEQSLCHSSSCYCCVWYSRLKITIKEILCFILFCPFFFLLPLSFSSPSSVLLFVSLCSFSQICPWSPSSIIPPSWCIVCQWQPTI